MKRKIRFKWIDGKVIEEEVTLRDEEHFRIQLKHKPKIFRNKKGKGSYDRHKLKKDLDD